MKVTHLFRVYAYNSSRNILVIELYTSLNEAQNRVSKFLKDGYVVVDDFNQQAKRPIILSEVTVNPTEFQLCYYHMVKSGQCDGITLIEGGDNEIQ